MSEQEKPRLDDADGNCKECGHPFNPHVVVAYDVNDFSKGGRDSVSCGGMQLFPQPRL